MIEVSLEGVVQVERIRLEQGLNRHAFCSLKLLVEEEKVEETSDEILTSEEDQKEEEITEETLIQDQGKIINAKEPDITVEETSPKTAWSKIILIIIVVVGILISIFYINKKRNLFRNSKN